MVGRQREAMAARYRRDGRRERRGRRATCRVLRSRVQEKARQACVCAHVRGGVAGRQPVIVECRYSGTQRAQPTLLR